MKFSHKHIVLCNLSYLLHLSRCRPEQLNVSLANRIAMPRQSFRCVRLVAEQHESIARRSAIRFLHEQNSLGRIQHRTRIVSVREEVQLEIIILNKRFVSSIQCIAI